MLEITWQFHSLGKNCFLKLRIFFRSNDLKRNLLINQIFTTVAIRAFPFDFTQCFRKTLSPKSFNEKAQTL